MRLNITTLANFAHQDLTRAMLHTAEAVEADESHEEKKVSK